MPTLSKAQEREEREQLGKGMLTSMFGLLFCWAPVLGALLASVGYVKVAARCTRRHRARRRVYLMASVLILVLCVAALMGEIWLYSRNPNILNDAGSWLLTRLTGQSAAPIDDAGDDTNYLGGVDYGDAPNPGLGSGIDPNADPYADPDAGWDESEGDIYHVEGAMG